MCSLIVCSISLYCYVRIKRVYYNSTSEMFVRLEILSFGELLRKFVFSFKTRFSVSHNSCLQSTSLYTTLKFLFFSNFWAWWDVILTI